jgi:hypothetical protein
MATPRLWVLGEQYEAREALKSLRANDEIDFLSYDDVTDAIRAFNLSLPGDGPWPNPLPASFPRPVLRMSNNESPLSAPDFFKIEGWYFVSLHMREVMGLPDWAVSYVPAVIETGSRRAHAHNYALMYPLAIGDAIDEQASVCTIEQYSSAKTGNLVTDIGGFGQVRFKSGLKVPSDLFINAVNSILIFATDELAQRVLAAGCTGVQFEHPLWFHEAHGNYVIRTVDGMGHIQWDAAGQSFKVLPISAAEADARPRIDESFEFQRELHTSPPQ